jgi:glutaredoxin
MDDTVARIIVAVGVIVVALLIARVSHRFQRPIHPAIDLSNTELPTGIVVFTSSECSNCAEARKALKAIGAEFREVTWELEPGLFQSIGVESVPLIVARDADGRPVGQLAGTPRPGALRSLVAAASASSVADS